MQAALTQMHGDELLTPTTLRWSTLCSVNGKEG